MDFFSAQDRAKRRTSVIVSSLAISIVVIVALVYFAAVAAWHLLADGFVEIASDATAPQALWHPDLFFAVASTVVVVVVGGSLYKILELSKGGQVVAESLGGRLLNRSTDDLNEKQLFNVVDEMAIASGVPVPPIYVMEEQGINAFAAGSTPNDAVIGMTRGALTQLSRAELQGVIAHEFSHILNGDMRLNLRLMGYAHGLLVVGIIGHYILRFGAHSGRGRSSPGLPVLLVGGALIIIGYAGTLFAQLMQAAVSRQREFLADASAVQFTRNPQGIGGALKKIAGLGGISRLSHPNFKTVGHLLFAPGFSGLFRTHPPVRRRIECILGQAAAEALPPIVVVYDDTGAVMEGPASGFAAGAEKAAPVQASHDHVVEPVAHAEIGQPVAADLAAAHALLENLPPRINVALREPFSAQAVVYGLLTGGDPETFKGQIRHLAENSDSAVIHELQSILGLVERLEVRLRLPVAELATPALRTLSTVQKQRFVANLEHLAHADQRLTVGEWSLIHYIQKLIADRGRESSPARRGLARDKPGHISAECAHLLSVLAYAGHADHQQARQAFSCATAKLETTHRIDILPHSDAGLGGLSATLDRLARCTADVKRRVLSACEACISADGSITTEESELFRTIAACLDCPVPPSAQVAGRR